MPSIHSSFVSFQPAGASFVLSLEGAFFFSLILSSPPSPQALSTGSPSASFQPVGAIFMFSLCHTPERQELLEGLEGRFYRLWCPRFCSCCLGNAPWSPGGGGGGRSGGWGGGGVLCCWVSWDCNNWREFCASCHPRALPRPQTETPPVFLWKRAICLAWSFSLGGRLLVPHRARGPQSCSWNGGCLCLSFHLTTVRLYLPESSFSPCLELWFLWLPPRGYLRVTWLWWPTALIWGRTGLYIFEDFKSFGLRVWRLYLGAYWDPPLWDTDRSWHTQNYWEIVQGQSWMIRSISYMRATLQNWGRQLFHVMHTEGQAKWRSKGTCSKWNNKRKPQEKP